MDSVLLWNHNFHLEKFRNINIIIYYISNTQRDGTKLEIIFWKPVGNASECVMIQLIQTEAVYHFRYISKYEIKINIKKREKYDI